jgi:hypothetical protein
MLGKNLGAVPAGISAYFRIQSRDFTRLVIRILDREDWVEPNIVDVEIAEIGHPCGLDKVICKSTVQYDLNRIYFRAKCSGIGVRNGDPVAGSRDLAQVIDADIA